MIQLPWSASETQNLHCSKATSWRPRVKSSDSSSKVLMSSNLMHTQVLYWLHVLANGPPLALAVWSSDHCLCWPFQSSTHLQRLGSRAHACLVGCFARVQKGCLVFHLAHYWAVFFLATCSTVQYSTTTALQVPHSSNSDSALHAFNKLNLICVLKIPLLLLQSLLWKVGENTYRKEKKPTKTQSEKRNPPSIYPFITLSCAVSIVWHHKPQRRWRY